MFFLAFGLLGIISWRELPVQLIPDISFPQLSVQAVMPGASPEKVEEELLIPIEAEIAKMKDIERISSTARNDGGSINVEFKLGVNMKYVTLKLEQRVNQLSARLPVGSRAFVGRNFDTEMLSNFLMELSIRGRDDLDHIRKIAEDKIKPELEKIDGITHVNISGGQLREAQVLVDEHKARQYEINLVDVISKINSFNREKEFLGRIVHNNSSHFITLSSQVTRLNQLENLIITPQIPLYLKDIADVTFMSEEPRRIFRINGRQSVGVFLLKDNVSNLIRVAERVESEIEKLNASFAPEDIEIAINFNAAEIMRDTINQVEKLAVVGAILALLILLFFLRNIKTVAVILVSIPISLLVTFNLMYYAGLTINVLSLVGLAIAIGMLVDNSIVVLENIFRHFELGASPEHASIRGCAEVTRSITASTATTIAVFVPVLFLQDKYLVILRELSLAVIFPMLTSLLVAFTLIPMFAAQFLVRRSARHRAADKRRSLIRKWQQNRLMDVFAVILKSRLRSPWQTVIVIAILFLFTLAVTIPFISMVDRVESETDVQIFVETAEEQGLNGTDLLTREVEAIAESMAVADEIRSLIREGNATVTLAFEDIEKYGKDFNVDDIRRNMRNQTDLIPGGTIAYDENELGRSSRGGSAGGGGGGGNPLSLLFGSESEKVIVKGYDQEAMRFLIEDIEERLESIPEIRRVNSNLQRGALEMQLWADKEALDRNNLTFSTVMQLLWASRRDGQEMTTKMMTDEGDILIRVKVKEEKKRGVEELKNLMIPVPGRGNVPIKSLTNVIIDEGPRMIRRVDQQRQAEVTYTFREEYTSQKQILNQLRAQVDQMIQTIQLPKGFTIEIIHEEDSNNPIYWVIGISALLIFMILAATFESMKFPWIIFAAIPMALIGSLWALIITGTSLAIFALISLLVLLGIVVNNGIILIDYISILRRRFSRNRALLYATRARVRPILMTSITTILGVLPFALKTGAVNEIWPPFAICLIGGLSFATVLTLVYIPVLYISIDDFIDGLMKCGKIGLIIDVILNVALVVYVFWWLDSRLWEVVFSLFGVSIINAILWNFYRYLSERGKTIDLGTDLTISIRNLTKIYNEPRRFVKDWNKRRRNERHLRARGELKVNIGDFIESLVWKAPLFVFFIYLHTYFSNRFWLLVLTICTYFLAGNILKTVRIILRLRKGEDAAIPKPVRFRRLSAVGYTMLIIAMFGYIQIRWGANPVWPALFCLIWFFLSYARKVTLRVYRGEIVIHKITGRFEKMRRRIYRMLISIPLLGRKKHEVKALHAVNMTIRNGMFGLLGPNGAGKTTLMRLISNICYQSRGIVYFNKFKLGEHRDYIQRFIGYLPQKFGLYGNFSAWEYLNYLALLNRFGNKEERHKLVESVIKNVNLWERRHDKLKTYSGGMKQRIGIAQTLLNLPKIIVVDEPTSGLDPRERIRFRNMLAQMSKNRIVIFSTHIVEDISTSCRELAVLDKGKVVFQGIPEDMRKKAVGKVWESDIPADAFQEWNKALKIVSHIKHDGSVKIKYISDTPPTDLEARQVEATLEDAYLLMLNPE